MPGTVFVQSDWDHRESATMQITPEPKTVGSVVAHVDLSDLTLTDIQSDAGDLRFTNSSGTELPFLLVNWDYNGGNPHGEAYIGYGTVDYNGTNSLFAYTSYKNGTAVGYDRTEDKGGDNVWPSGYVSVHALHESGTKANLVSNSYDAANVGTPTTATGKVSPVGSTGAMSTNSEKGSASVASYRNLAATDIVVMSCWINVALAAVNANDFDNPIMQWRGASQGCSFGLNTNGRVFVYTDGANTDAQADASGSIVADGSWHLVEIHFDPISDIVRVYVDGVLDYSVSSYTDTSASTGTSLRIGNSNVGNEIDGLLDHATLFIGTRSADLIEIEHEMQDDPTTFWGSWTVETNFGDGNTLSTYRPRADDAMGFF